MLPEGDGAENFGVLMCHKLVIPAMPALLEAGDVPLDGFLYPSHIRIDYSPHRQPFARPTLRIASTSPAVEWGEASAAGSYPKSRSAVDVSGLMLASRACRKASP